MKKSLLYYLILVFCSVFSNFIFADNISVNFIILPQLLPPNSEIYITGNHKQLGDWDTNDIKFDKQNDGTWTKSLSFRAGTKLEYKITRGSWLNEAVDSLGIELPNFVLEVTNDTTIILKIFNWRDTFKGPTVLSAERMNNKGGRIELFENWKYHSGDDTIWASPQVNDSDWKKIDPRLPRSEYQKIEWNNIGWFRIHLKVDSSLWNIPLSFRMRQAGASEVYLNGRLLYQFGEIGTTKNNEVKLQERNPRYILFDNKIDQVLAVRYSNYDADYIIDLDGNPGFDIFLEDLNQHITGRAEEIRISSIYQMIFTVIPIVLAFLHILLFLFNPRAKENIYYAICMIGFSILSYANFQNPFTTNIDQIIFNNNMVLFSVTIAMLFGLLTIYSRTYDKIPKQFYVILFIAVSFIIFIIIHPIITLFIYINIFLFIVAIEMLRNILKPNPNKQEWTWLIGMGFIILFLSITYQILIDTDVVEPIFGNRIVYVYGILALSITMSVNLARDFSIMNEKIILQERKAQERELEKRMIEADNQRKTKELEDARNLQLSMLPNCVNDFPGFDICFHMDTATEVGGDYYDYHISEDGTLTIAIGDATGHGMKAGTMVSVIKSLFIADAAQTDILSFFKKCSDTIKQMNLGNLYMALMLVKIKDNKLSASAAGMPPIYIYRQKTKLIEEMTLKGMPLGGGPDFPYKLSETTLYPGDTVLLMSDGFPELFNEKNEMLDYHKIIDLFLETAEDTADNIVKYLTVAGQEWRKDRPQDDDITFIVLKVKDNRKIFHIKN